MARLRRAAAAALAVVCMALWARAALGQPLGPPFQVNSFTPGAQTAPAVAAGTNGSFVVVWQSTDQDGDYFGVFGQRYASSGATLGTEFQVNTYTDYLQELPAVALAADGSFLVVWDGYGDGSTITIGDIFARRYASSGAAQGTEFQVSSGAAYIFEGYPAVAASGTGFVVVWDDLEDVLARRLDANGGALGAPFLVNMATVGFQHTAAVAATTDGGFVVAWTDAAGDLYGDGHGYGVFARRFDSTGQPAGSQFQVNTTTLDDQYNCRVAASPGGGFVAVWESVSMALEESIAGQRFDAAGNRLGSEFRVDTATGGDADDPQVAADAAGNFIVTWVSPPMPGSATSILARRYDGAGEPVSDVEDVTDGSLATQAEPAVGAAPDGRHIVVWRRGNAENDAEVFGHRFGAIQSTPSLTPTATATPPPTFTHTATVTATATVSATPSPTSSSSPTRTSTPTATPTGTATATVTPTTTHTATRTASSAPTATPTATRTATATPSATRTVSPTGTATNSQTPTPTRSATPTRTSSPSPSATPSTTPTRTGTPTRTPTSTPSTTPIATASATPVATATATHSRTPSATASGTPTRSGTPTPSATASGTPTRSGTPTPSATASPTSTPTATPSPTPTRNATASPSASPTETVTPLASPSLTASASPTASPTRTPSAGPSLSPSASPSPSQSPFPSASPSHTPSPSPSASPSTSPSATATASPPPALTATATASPPPTDTATSLPSPTVPRCAGDCDGDGQVSISELIRAVNYALDDTPPDLCPAIDANADARVTVDELVRAVTRALNGCSA